LKPLHPPAAHAFLQANPRAVLIDCRSEIEFYFVGHPIGAHHVAWSDGPDWSIDADSFVAQVRALASEGCAVLLICRSGNRSADAAVALERAGFGNVYNVVHGFEGELDANNHRGTLSGWRHDGLPWEQS